jgi:nicotinamide-nucleotide amidase
MALGVRRLLKTDFGISVTGIAGPTGGTKIKPIGLTFIAVSSGTRTICQKCLFKGSRKSIKTQAATQALKLLDQSFI